MTVGEIWSRYSQDGRAVIVKPRDWEAWDPKSEPVPVAFPNVRRRSAVWIVQHLGMFLLCRDMEFPIAYPVVGRVDAGYPINEDNLLAVMRAVGMGEE
jgi:hypothetical protein